MTKKNERADKNDDSIKQIALRVILNHCQKQKIVVKKIQLFGSRANRNPHPESDWDFFILIQDSIPFSKKQQLCTQIKRNLAKLKIPNDIIVQSVDKYQQLKDYPGTISSINSREGISLWNQ